MTPRKLCIDYQCPAQISCARAYLRSPEYAAHTDHNVPMVMFERDRTKDSCSLYRLDKPRPWMLPAHPHADRYLHSPRSGYA